MAWASYEQRPHHFVREFVARAGGGVLWVDPYPTRFPAARDVRRLRVSDRVAPPDIPGVTRIEARGLPVEPVGAGRWLNRRMIFQPWLERVRARTEGGRLLIGIGRPSDLALAALETLPVAASLYDAMDDFPEFYDGRARRWTAACEQRIADRVSLILTSSSGLTAKFDRAGAKRLQVLNAFAMDALPPPASSPPQPPVLGYVGTIGRWFDWPLLTAIARARPDVRVRLIGPLFTPPPAPLPDNVTTLPACAEAEAIEHMRGFSAGLIPFVRSSLTNGVDPVKFYGYRAMGLPVLTTRFGEMARREGEPGVFFLDQAGRLDETIAGALQSAPDAGAVAGFRQAYSWSSRFRAAGVFERFR